MHTYLFIFKTLFFYGVALGHSPRASALNIRFRAPALRLRPRNNNYFITIEFFIFFLQKVIIKEPEDERPRPEQVEGWINSAVEDRTRNCGNSLG